MLSDRARDALEGIRFNIAAIQDFTDGMTAEEIAADMLTFYAVTRTLEIIPKPAVVCRTI